MEIDTISAVPKIALVSVWLMQAHLFQYTAPASGDWNCCLIVVSDQCTMMALV